MDKIDGSKKALKALESVIDKSTLLLLSGGTSPDLLYKMIAESRNLKPGAIALVDERFGKTNHDNSNEKMILETGLFTYIYNEGILIHKILNDWDLDKTTSKYELVIQDLFKKFPKKMAVMGIGADGHTAGIKPGLDYDHKKWVVSYDDKGVFGKRITLTFEALSQIDEFIILAFGQSKKKALQEMLTQPQNKIPAAFYNKTSSNLFTDI